MVKKDSEEDIAWEVIKMIVHVGGDVKVELILRSLYEIIKILMKHVEQT